MGIMIRKGRRFRLPEIKKITDNAYRIYNTLFIKWNTFEVPYREHMIFTLRKTVSENKRSLKRLKQKTVHQGNPNVGGGETALTGGDSGKGRYSISAEASGTDIAIQSEERRLQELQDKINKLAKRK